MVEALKSNSYFAIIEELACRSIVYEVKWDIPDYSIKLVSYLVILSVQFPATIGTVLNPLAEG